MYYCYYYYYYYYSVTKECLTHDTFLSRTNATYTVCIAANVHLHSLTGAF